MDRKCFQPHVVKKKNHIMPRVIPALCIPILLALLWSTPIGSYPYDGYALTGIRRLERLRLIQDGTVKGPQLLPGQLKTLADIRLNLTGERGESLAALPGVDPELQKKIDALFPDRHQSYALSVLDITPGKPFRYAERQAGKQYVPGSVGKLAIAAGLFAELQRLYPDDTEKRHELLRTRMATGGKWIVTDSHTIPVFDPLTKVYTSRPPREDDVFTLYEWTDHMLSASANAAASVVWKEVILMRAFGKQYPPPPEQEREFFEKTPRNELSQIVVSTVNDPLQDIGIDQRAWHLGSMFTNMGKKMAPGGGGSYATPRAMMQFLVALERGKVVDEWSSLEIKRMMYMTARRIRYASSPSLNDAAVYFKSGSQYKCKEEPDFKCGKYMGNLENYMNSVAIVEHPDGRAYLAVLMSNVLYKNSAVEHQSLATFINRILAK